MPKITKVLVANRGEIAIRIFRACREMRIASVAIYSEIDSDALHLKFADEAYFLGGPTPASGYLDIARILEIAKSAGANGVHPGYGFLAENSAFASAVVAAGITWIGPPPSVIETMGDKVSARQVAAEAGVSGVPGSGKPIEGPEAIESFAQAHGWPVTLKAAHGGGGRGFRIVRSLEEGPAAFESATRESQASFGRPELYIERYLEHPRHIEVQILGDSLGSLVHLGERDCSIQRRHQKLIEESPSPALTPALRQEICDAAVRVAASAGYSSAGTIEFLLEPQADPPKFWFLEMNTRLQVEHPVTEFVTGIDLVKQMIRVAEGAPLGFAQQDISFKGHAIECRINAEDPGGNFLPNPGVISEFKEPGGPGIRVDAGVAAGNDIPENYDSLIAKLVCYGADREEAIARVARALDEFHIKGVHTTMPFDRLVMKSDWFKAGDFSTQTVETSLDLSGLKDAGPAPSDKKDSVARRRKVHVEVEGKRYEVDFTETLTAEAARVKPTPPDLSGLGGASAHGETLVAPMRGTIVRTLVDLGALVKAGDAIIVLEAMKMENMVLCHRDGVLKELRVKAGDTVSMGAALAVIEDPLAID